MTIRSWHSFECPPARAVSTCVINLCARLQGKHLVKYDVDLQEEWIDVDSEPMLYSNQVRSVEEGGVRG